MFGRKNTSSLQSKDFLRGSSFESSDRTLAYEQDRDIAQLEQMQGSDPEPHPTWTNSLMQKAQKLVGRSTRHQELQSLEEEDLSTLPVADYHKNTDQDWNPKNTQNTHTANEEHFMDYATKKVAFESELEQDFPQPETRSSSSRGFVSQMLPEDFSEDNSEEVMEELEIEKPETVIGEGVSLKGQLCFKRYLCINGEFEGDLKSSGKVKVGKTGVVRSNLKLHSAVIEGKVVGDLIIDDLLELRGSAQVYGNIRARYLRVDDGVTLNGHVQIMPGGLVKASESSLFAEKETASSSEGLVDPLEEADFSLSH